jgi:hypothetical protein
MAWAGRRPMRLRTRGSCSARFDHRIARSLHRHSRAHRSRHPPFIHVGPTTPRRPRHVPLRPRRERLTRLVPPARPLAVSRGRCALLARMRRYPGRWLHVFTLSVNRVAHYNHRFAGPLPLSRNPSRGPGPAVPRGRRAALRVRVVDIFAGHLHCAARTILGVGGGGAGFARREHQDRVM